MTLAKRQFLKLVAGAGALPFAGPRSSWAADKPDSVGIDYAYYNPVSLLLKKTGWLDEELGKDKIAVRWVLSLGSNKALEYLRGSSIDFGSTAGSAVVVARAGGLPVKSIYVYSKPEWTALVARRDSGISKIEDLKGRSVAVTRGHRPSYLSPARARFEGAGRTGYKSRPAATSRRLSGAGEQAGRRLGGS
jgi:sulfonate transport system substrate-binding protein